MSKSIEIYILRFILPEYQFAIFRHTDETLTATRDPLREGAQVSGRMAYFLFHKKETHRRCCVDVLFFGARNGT